MGDSHSSAPHQNREQHQPVAQNHPKPTFIPGRATPHYIRSITVVNRSNKNLVFCSTHKSGQASEVEVKAGT